MTDLSMLFRSNKSTSNIPSNKERQFNSFQQTSRPQSRNLFNTSSQQPTSLYNTITQNIFKPSTTFFTSPLRRSQHQLSKTCLQNYDMVEQIDYFKQLSQSQFLKKSLMVTGFMMLLTVFGLINRKVFFQFILLGISLLMNQSMIIENKTVKLFVQTLPALTYTALFYDILAQGDHVGHYYVTLANLPALIISFAATVNFLTLEKSSFLTEQNFKGIQVHKKPLEIIQYFFKLYIQRIKNIIKLSTYLLVLNLALAFIFIIYCIISLQSTLFTQTIYTLPIGAVIFVLIDVFIFGVEFLAREITLFKLNQHFYQLQVCMSLLRLRSNSTLHPQNSKIHQRCLIEIAKQLKNNSDYLLTPVKVNYAINNYRDIFEIYASQQLSYLHYTINNIIFQILRNNKIIKSTKQMKEDVFIHLRKLYARLQNNYLVFKILSEIQTRKLVFLIMVRLSRQSPLRTKILQTLNQVKESANKATNLQQCIEIGDSKLKEWIRQLQTLQRSLRNDSIGRNVSYITERDEHGWAHYRRPNTLDIQQV